MRWRGRMLSLWTSDVVMYDFFMGIFSDMIEGLHMPSPGQTKLYPGDDPRYGNTAIKQPLNIVVKTYGISAAHALFQTEPLDRSDRECSTHLCHALLGIVASSRGCTCAQVCGGRLHGLHQRRPWSSIADVFSFQFERIPDSVLAHRCTSAVYEFGAW